MIFCVLYEAPIALKSHGIFSGKKVTSHPSVDKQLKEAGKPMFFQLLQSLFLQCFYSLFSIAVNFLTHFAENVRHET